MRDIKARDGTTFQVAHDEIPYVIHHRQDFNRGHNYSAYDGPKVVGFLRYIKNFPAHGIISIHELEVDEEYRELGIATSLLTRLHADNPDDKIDPGHPGEDGLDYIRQIWESEPEVAATAHLYPEVAEQLGV